MAFCVLFDWNYFTFDCSRFSVNITNFRYLQIRNIWDDMRKLRSTKTFGKGHWSTNNTSNCNSVDSSGWHETKDVEQHPPHRLTLVHDGTTTSVGSLSSLLSANFKGTIDNSGLQMAGGARLLNERSTSSPPLKRAKESHWKTKQKYIKVRRLVHWFIPTYFFCIAQWN